MTDTQPIYLDYHAATPFADGVLNAMRAAEGAFANPSSVHAAGRFASGLLERAREQVAGSIGAKRDEIVWTSGGTEACWLGVLGIGGDKHTHVLTTPIEHPAIHAATRRLAHSGTLTQLSLTALRSGELEVPAGALVAVQWVNHETGTIVPLRTLASQCQKVGARLVVDATQAYGRLPIDMRELRELGVSALALASHKVGGPSGAGALWVPQAESRELTPIFDGSQERGLRAGTPGLHCLVGFGAAASQVRQRVSQMEAVAEWRDSIESAGVALGGVVNGADGFERVASVTNMSFSRWRSSSLVAALDLEGLCVSAGSACASGAEEVSPVVQAFVDAFGGEEKHAASCVRFSFGPEQLTSAQVELAKTRLETVLSRKR